MTTLIFTDGASRGNPGPGGYGAIIMDTDDKTVVELGGREEKTTNNRMELRAVVEALEYLHKNNKTKKKVVYTDSRYLVHGITRWIHNWKKRDWQTKGKTDVLNRDLWERLDAVVDESIAWELLPGHSGVIGNERADEIATMYADKNYPGLYHGPLTAYPLDIGDITVDTVKAEQRKAKKKRQSAQAHSYISLVDGKVCRHKTWASCEARVKGKDAQFRKSISAEDEARIVREWGYDPTDIQDC